MKTPIVFNLSCVVNYISDLLSNYMIRNFSFEGNRFEKIFWLTLHGNKYVLGNYRLGGNKYKLTFYILNSPEICSKQAIFRKIFLEEHKAGVTNGAVTIAGIKINFQKKN